MEGHIAIAMHKEIRIILKALMIWHQQTTIFKNVSLFHTMHATQL
jgi:hypothetical protein